MREMRRGGKLPASEVGRAKMIKLWKMESEGCGKQSRLGKRPMAQTATYFKPQEKDVQEACSFRGKSRNEAAGALRAGNFSATTMGMVAQGIEKQWQPATVEAKHGYVRKFLAFMRATGRRTRFFPELADDGGSGTIVLLDARDSEVPSTREEEQSLCEFAVLRVMAGNSTDSAEGIVSHIRTWSRTILVREYGVVGAGGRMSMTSQYLKALHEFFPPENSFDKRREPFTWPIVKLIHDHAKQVRWEDPGVAVAVAYAGLFRMGELTATETRPFDPVVDMAENDLKFYPTFWTADRVVVQLGISKADRRGRKSKLRPRILPIYEGSPGWMLRELLARRLQVKEGREPVLRAKPLFCARNGKQLSRDTVLRFVRLSLEKAGYTKEQSERYGTHSARIGGATRLFQLGATAEILKRMGGWSSDAYKEYVRIQQQDTMTFTRRMCSEA
jgi:hypothetical protein